MGGGGVVDSGVHACVVCVHVWCVCVYAISYCLCNAML